NDLALQIRLLDDIVVDDADGADAGRGEVEQRRRSETSRADHQHPRVLEPALAVDAQIGDDEMPAIAGHLVGSQLGGRLDKRGKHTTKARSHCPAPPQNAPRSASSS